MVTDESYTSFQSEDGEVKLDEKESIKGYRLKKGRRLLYPSSSNVSAKARPPMKRESEELPLISPAKGA